MTDPSSPPSPAALFDALADSYDQTGIDFFQPVAARLVELVEPRVGERMLDVGCGRGAATIPLARAVGAAGEVVAVDVSPGMVAGARAEVEALGLANVAVAVGDATALEVGDGYDAVVSSLVLFFLPAPPAVLADWVSRARPSGGRVGISTFGPLDDTSRALDALFDPWLPQGLLDARTSGTRGPFASDEGVVAMMRDAGTDQIENLVEPSQLTFEDVSAWRRFTMSTGQRAMWQHVPEAERPALLDRAARILSDAPGGGSGATVTWQMRYTVGKRRD